MASDFKKSIKRNAMPEVFSDEVANTVCRIDENHHVIGVVHLQKNVATMCTVQESVGQLLASTLPAFSELVRNAVAEIDVLDELIAYRIETKKTELLVAPFEDHSAIVLHKKAKNKPKVYS